MVDFQEINGCIQEINGWGPGAMAASQEINGLAQGSQRLEHRKSMASARKSMAGAQETNG